MVGLPMRQLYKRDTKKKTTQKLTFIAHRPAFKNEQRTYPIVGKKWRNTQHSLNYI